MQRCENCGCVIDLTCDTPHWIDHPASDMTVCEGCFNDYETFGPDFGVSYRAAYERECRVRERESA